MAGSILNEVKKVVGLFPEDESFDLDILMHVNSAFSTLEQLGVGPEGGFAIADSSTDWSAFIGTDPRLNQVKTYVILRVRMVFDPPSTSFVLTSFEKQIQELEWRMNVLQEYKNWPRQDEIILDGGQP